MRQFQGWGMEKHILSEIVAVEKEIQERLAAEQGKAEARLAETRMACEEELRKAEEQLRELLAAKLAVARNEALREAETCLKDASVRAERLARLDDVALRRIVRESLFRIVPGSANDRQDVQN